MQLDKFQVAGGRRELEIVIVQFHVGGWWNKSGQRLRNKLELNGISWRLKREAAWQYFQVMGLAPKRRERQCVGVRLKATDLELSFKGIALDHLGAAGE